MQLKRMTGDSQPVERLFSQVVPFGHYPQSFHKVFVTLLTPVTNMRSTEGRRHGSVVYPGFLTNNNFFTVWREKAL